MSTDRGVNSREEDYTMSKYAKWSAKAILPQITLRSTIAGLIIGTIVLISNFQFGLQTGWVSMMSLPSALLGFAMFKSLQSYLNYKFTDVENVFVQSIAVAVGTGPLAYGFVGIIPALEKFLTVEESGLDKPIQLSLLQLCIWSTGLAFFGVFFAVPLRKQVVIKEKLPFPSGSATATLISVLHNTEIYDDFQDDENEVNPSASKIDNTDRTDDGDGSSSNEIASSINESENEESQNDEARTVILDDEQQFPQGEQININIQNGRGSNLTIIEAQDIDPLKRVETYRKNIRALTITFSLSAFYTILAYFIPILRSLPIFSSYLSQNYLWNFQPSPAYVGQGIIMGPATVSYMLVGAILGWGILAPMAKYFEWAPGEIDDWKDGGQGWILWISLSVMVADSVVSFLVVTIRSLFQLYASYTVNRRYLETVSATTNDAADEHPLIHTRVDRGSNNQPHSSAYHGEHEEDNNTEEISHNKSSFIDEVADKADIDLDPSHLVSMRVTIIGLIISSIGCIIAVRLVFGPVIPVYALVISIILSLFLSVLGVRALGETDLNPVSGIGKLSQLFFALVIPNSVPGAVLINLVAGGIAEAGAQQAGDLMQDLKTGHLIGASPQAQFIAQLIGATYSIFLSSIMYKIYNAVYEIPGKIFRVPTAVIWIDCSRLVTGKGLPKYALGFSIFFMVVFVIISLLKNIYPKSHNIHSKLVYLPSGVAVGIGIYNTPSFTLARFVGGMIAYFWLRHCNHSHDGKIRMIVFSSGLVLGEGLLSCLTMLFTSLGIPHL
ncbi:hypothetical protein PACTADRAFT_51935 [Pachysolen tannophilus NRRL Y-2460]|uniref:OPT superfamily oligopeptide transporter n=1 Tax=Pachysolen tannophilus NRRL Y-2460 TaxID=669874 RepID=A0A1E4TNJ9_PACTA|nr:hypothetical protein PACTADRAFT_51935 [Pachysolen tannophilus NRRL Y-2460]